MMIVIDSTGREDKTILQLVEAVKKYGIIAYSMSFVGEDICNKLSEAGYTNIEYVSIELMDVYGDCTGWSSANFVRDRNGQ